MVMSRYLMIKMMVKHDEVVEVIEVLEVVEDVEVVAVIKMVVTACDSTSVLILLYLEGPELPEATDGSAKQPRNSVPRMACLINIDKSQRRTC